ncbi:MAG: TonB-dependent receptor [Blastocatellia bacterium]|nr:TonB-dependent receptor [Blastocatellia bacterium]
MLTNLRTPNKFIRSSFSYFTLIFLLLTLFAVAGFAQSYQGSLRGALKDSSGNTLAAATLTLTNEETGVSRTTVTNDVGEYVFEKVDPGKYKITANLSGFKKTDRAGVIVETQQQVTLDLTLNVGEVTETVTISGDISLIETSTASTGTVLGKQTLDELPNAGRSPFFLTAIAPNVIAAGNPTYNRQQDQGGSSTISLAGGPVRGNNYIIDGVPITDLTNLAIIIPTIEAIQEVKVQLNTYDAEAGRTGGGVFNTLARSGSNDLHGSLFGFVRPSALGANNFFNNRNGVAKPNVPYKLYGGSLGGPVRVPWLYNGRDRTFFWAAFEGYRQSTFLSDTLTVPTELERKGDFSKSGFTVTDPTTGQPFPGNVIPTNRLDPVGAKVVNYFPLPRNGQSRFVETSILNDRADQQTIKLDHEVTRAYKVSAFYAHYGSREPFANYYNNPANPNGILLKRGVNALALNNIFTLSPTTLLSVRYGYNTFDNNSAAGSAGFDVASLGFANSFLNDIVFKKFPRIEIAGNAYGPSTQSALGGEGPADRRLYSQNLQASVSKLIGRHSLKFGGDYRRLATDFQQYGQASGAFNFDAAGTGNAIANLLLGRLNFAANNTAQISVPLRSYVDYWGGYVQDDFRVNSKLTVNVGLRYEYETGLRERDNRITVGFDRNAASPLQVPGLNLKGGLIYAGVNGARTELSPAWKTKFGPRIGFAYQLNDKTTLRGGYGIFWAPQVFTFTVGGIGALGFSAISTVAAGQTLSNPFPNGLIKPTGNSLGLLTNVGTAVDYVDQDRGAPYVQQYSLDIQRELPGGVALTLSYIGSRGTQLSLGSINDSTINLNQLTPQVLSQYTAAQLTERVANPFSGIAAAGALGRSNTIERRQLLRPFPQFTDILMHGAGGGNSFYNALTVKAQKRLSQGLGFLASYTFSKQLDNVLGQGNYFATAIGGPLNTHNLRGEYGLSTFDTPHRFTLSGSYELPFGKGKALLNQGGVLDRFVGGWQINAIGLYQAGFPVTITQAVNNTQAYSRLQRPNLVAGVSAATAGSVQSRLDNFLNPAAFSAAPAGTFGNTPRTLNVRTPAPQRTWDIGLLKDTQIFERLNAQFRLEAINAFNTPVFRLTNTAFGTANFGKITSQANFPRTVQISLRLFW